jgi:hypothetical protein
MLGHISEPAREKWDGMAEIGQAQAHFVTFGHLDIRESRLAVSRAPRD